MEKLPAMSSYLTNDTTRKYLESMLGKKSEQFITALSTMVGSNPKLNLCERKSILGSALKSVGMGLSFDPNLGFAYVIPYNDNSTGESIATFQMGVKGFIQLAQRSGQIRKLNAMSIVEGEFKGRDAFGDPIIEFLPEQERIKGEVIGYMAGLQTTSGFEKIIYWTLDDVKKHAETYSQSYRNAIKYNKKNNVVWIDNFDKMAEKTVLKALISKYAPMSTELQEAIKYDQSAIILDPETGKEEIDYIDSKEVIVETINKEQVLELASAIPKDIDSKQVLKEIGFKSFKDIPNENFEKILEQIKNMGGKENASSK